MNKKLFLILSCAVLCVVGCKSKSANSESQSSVEQDIIMNETNMKLCQSCGMPLSEEVFGTNADGSHSQEYCKWCFANGKMTSPDISMEEMIEICVPYMVEKGINADEARAMMQKLLPALKRWKAE